MRFVVFLQRSGLLYKCNNYVSGVNLHDGMQFLQSRKEVEMGRFQEPILKRKKAGKISKKNILSLAPHNIMNIIIEPKK